jgi:hypothetical protein
MLVDHFSIDSSRVRKSNLEGFLKEGATGAFGEQSRNICQSAVRRTPHHQYILELNQLSNLVL